MATIATIFSNLVNMRIRPLNDQFIAGGREKTVFLDIIGGLNGIQAVPVDPTLTFVTGAEYELETADATQLRTEQQSADGVAGSATDDVNFTNNLQIHQEAVEITHIALGQMGLSGLNIEDSEALTDKFDFEREKKLIKVRRTANVTFLANQVAVPLANKDTKPLTRGLSKVCELGTDTDFAAAALTKEAVEAHVEDMVDAGALFNDPVIVCNLGTKRKLSAVYGLSTNAGNTPSREVAGQNLTQIVTESGITFTIIVDQDAPNLEFLFSDLEALSVKGLEVPGAGIVYSFKPASSGATEKEILQAVIGLDHGPYRLHGRLHNFT